MPQAKPATAAVAITAAPKLLHVFKAGGWTTMAGERIEFSQADVEATARAYDPRISKAPLVIGHPATDDPAKGWAAVAVANDRGLFVLPEKVDPVFAEEAKAGRWGTVSAKFYRPTDPSNPVPGIWYLRHVGILGAVNPAVKGLDAPEFSDADDGCVCFQEGVEFSEWDDMTNAGLWRNLREWILGKFGAGEADKVLPGYEVRSLELGAQEEINKAHAEAAAAGASATPAFTEPQRQESTVTEAEAALLRTQATAQAARIAELEAAQVSARRAATHAAHVAFCEGLPGVTPAMRDVVVATLDHLAEQPAVVEFGEGEAKAPLIDGFRAMLSALPAAVEFGETATHARAAAGDAPTDTVAFAAPAGYTVDAVALATHRKALAHQAAHKTSYADAVKAVA